MKRFGIWLLLVTLYACTTGFTFGVGEDWTQSSKNFSTSGTAGTGDITITGNGVISGTLSIGGTD